MKIYLIFLLSFTILFPISSASQNRDYDTCSNKLNCGSLVNISYPFYDGSTRPIYCGHPGFKLDCIDSIPRINISDGHEYYVKSIDVDAYSISVYREDKWTDNCPDNLINTTIDISKFKFSSSNENITFFYACNNTNAQISSDLLLHRTCNLGGYKGEVGYYLTPEMVDQNPYLFQICKSILFLPILQSQVDELGNLEEVIRAFHLGFELDFMAENEACLGCGETFGQCGYNWRSKEFVWRM